jgi:hypothetical protein
VKPVDHAFTPAVRAVQVRRRSATSYAGMEMGDRVDENLAAFIAAQNSFMLASANADGQPYIQHRGGPAGFLRVMNERTLGFADFAGNRQYISTGNFSENPRAFIFLIDYAHRQRVKIWGSMKVLEDDPELIAQLKPEGYRVRVEAAMLFEVSAWDANCPAHIPQLLPASEVAAAIAVRDAKIAALEEQLRALRA